MRQFKIQIPIQQTIQFYIIIPLSMPSLKSAAIRTFRNSAAGIINGEEEVVAQPDGALSALDTRSPANHEPQDGVNGHARALAQTRSDRY